MKHVKQILQAYSDCNGFKGERDLKFFCSTPLTAGELKTIFPALTPEGYNAFDPVESINTLIETFGENADYHVAREGSVCVYIKPKGNFWLNGGRAPDLNNFPADEILFCPEKGMIRVWWD